MDKKIVKKTDNRKTGFQIRLIFMQHLFISLLLTTTFIISHAYGQQRLEGRVIDSLTSEALQGAGLRLLNTRDSLISNQVSQLNGTFVFTTVAPGQYTLVVNFIGYKTQRLPVKLGAPGQGRPLTVRLPSDITALDAIDIIAPIQEVVLKGDTTEFNAAAYTTEPYADADALITQLPGIELDEQGNVIAQGEQVQRIMVDGKEFFSSDPRIALKTLPADIIDKIQLIDEQSEQARFTGFDDGNRRKIINIVTKPDRRHGYFGRMAGAYGSTERYNGGGYMNFFNGDRRVSMNLVSNNVNQNNFSMAEIGVEDQSRRGGRGGSSRYSSRGTGGGAGNAITNNISLNYSNEWQSKLKFNADYTFNTQDNSISTIVNRETLLGRNANQLNFRNSDNNSINNSHRANANFEYDIDTNQRLTFRPNIRFQRNDRVSVTNSSTMLNTQEPLNASNRTNDNRNHNITFGGDLNYRLRLGKPGRTVSLSANGSLNSNRGLAYNLSLNEFYTDYVLGRADTVNNENNNYSYGNGITGRVAYTEPLGERSRLQANYSIRNTNNYSNRETFEFLAETGQFSELNRQLSNEFNNDYVYHSGGLGYQFSLEPLLFDFGLDFQKARLQNERLFPDEIVTLRDFGSYLPHANLTYRFSREKQLRFEYNTATSAPSINQLQDVINNQNTLNIRAGNPFLKQEYQHRFRLNFRRTAPQTGANLEVNGQFDFSNNSIVNSTWIAAHDTLIAPGILLGKGGNFSRPENIDGAYNMRANVTYGTPVKALKIKVSMTSEAYHNHDIGLLNQQMSYSNTYGVRQRLAVNSSISQKLLFNVSYTGNYSMVRNNRNEGLSYNYYNQTLRNDFTWIFWKGMRVNSSVMYNYNTGLAAGYDQQFILWNASIGKKLFKRQEGEITLSAYDLLNKNINVSRSISESYIEDSQSNMLRQYFMLGFTYNLRKFGGGGGRERPSGMGGERPASGRSW